MAERYEILIKVISQKGKCPAEHKVGDEWVIKEKTPQGICLSAFSSVYPNARVLMFNGHFPYGDDPDAVTATCPDPENPVTFEMKRLRK
ncbi:TIGR04076 family protein [Chloroflexota bacterium]